MKRKFKIIISFLLVCAMIMPTTLSAFANSINFSDSTTQAMKQK